MVRHPFRGPNDMADVVGMVNNISQKRYGCPADCLPTAIREVLLEDIAKMLCKLDALNGRAS